MVIRFASPGDKVWGDIQMMPARPSRSLRVPGLADGFMSRPSPASPGVSVLARRSGITCMREWL